MTHLIIVDTVKNTVEFVDENDTRKLVQKKDAQRMGLTLGLLKAAGWQGKQFGKVVIFHRESVVVEKVA